MQSEHSLVEEVAADRSHLAGAEVEFYIEDFISYNNKLIVTYSIRT